MTAASQCQGEPTCGKKPQQNAVEVFVLQRDCREQEKATRTTGINKGDT